MEALVPLLFEVGDQLPVLVEQKLDWILVEVKVGFPA